MDWLHGWAFQQGSARRPEYDGNALAKRGTVVVTINNCLGALGFLVSSIDGLYGNFGLMDQRAALYWIISHIQYFGGDPNNITLFGEGASAVMALLHLLMEPDNDNSNTNNEQQYPDMEDEISIKTRTKDGQDTRGYTNSKSYYNNKGYKKIHNSNDDPRITDHKKRKLKKRRLFHKVIIQSDPLGLQFRSIVVADFIGEAFKPLICIEEIMRAQPSLMGITHSVSDFFNWGLTLTHEFKLMIRATSSPSTSTTTISQP